MVRTPEPPRAGAGAGAGAGGAGVWYLAYGSNADPGRLGCYLRGGRPEGGRRVYPGCRDRAAPRASAAVEVPGAVYFATESPVWGGGRAFYDPAVPGGPVLARAYLITPGQFSDLAAQEMYRTPGQGPDLDLTGVLRDGRAVLGDGRYETLVCAGLLDGRPLLTFTAPWAMGAVPPNPPSAAYLRCVAHGLLGAGAWDARTVAGYLAARPGAVGCWTAGQVLDLAGYGEGPAGRG
ncbi:histone deacetylase [Streptomyces changanensis]|uniref:histone deacetylase n=1 Tax=Streptomyces TaxID=1883 RepID=UPI000B2CD01F